MTDGTAWLVEFMGAKPCPVFMTKKAEYTTDTRFAEHFASKESAEAWIQEKGLPINLTGAEIGGWAAVEHRLSIGA
jgi:hypothetical protein